MRLQAATLSLVLGLFLLPCTSAHAQIGDAVAAFKSAVRDANRALNPRRSRKRRKPNLRSTLMADQGPPPLPLSNPRRRQAEQPRAAKRRSAKRATTTKTIRPSSNGKTDKTATAAATAPLAPPPDIWSPQQIAKARKQCQAILRKVQAKLVPADPIKKGPCGDAAPYRLASLGKKHRVVFSPAPVLNCRMIQALDTWLRKGLQPLAKKHLGGPIARVSVMSSYSCRNAYGRKKTRLSEHGKANALDIGGFRTSKGVKTRLLADWGLTQRDLIAKAKREEAARLARAKRGNNQSEPAGASAKVNSYAATEPSRRPRSRATSGGVRVSSQIIAQPDITRSNITPTSTSGELPPPLPNRRPSLRERLDWAKAAQARRTARRAKAARGNYKDELDKFLFPRQDLGGPKLKKRSAKPDKNGSSSPTINKEAFLKGAHRTACKIFGTVLGPEANDAHRDHFHVDMAPRRFRNYCR